jgi:DNA-binding beta-propeller fold protein YncE
VRIASDDCVFVADCGNNRVQVLTPRLDFHGFIGAGELRSPTGVCANADVVVVSERDAHRVAVFNRVDGALVHRFGSMGGGDGELNGPAGVCFLSGDRHIAVADSDNSRVSVFGVDGSFVRHVGVGVLVSPDGVACSACDELVVADAGNGRVVLFDGSGEHAANMTIGRRKFFGVAIHGAAIFARARCYTVRGGSGTVCTIFQ